MQELIQNILATVDKKRRTARRKEDPEKMQHEIRSKAEARGWRLLKLEKAIAYREAGQYPLTDDELERIIAELKDVLSHEK